MYRSSGSLPTSVSFASGTSSNTCANASSSNSVFSDLGWENATRAINFQNDNDATLAAIRSTINHQRFAGTTNPGDFYMLLSSYYASEGVSYLNFVTKPTGIDSREKFMRNNRVAKVYANGEVTLFRYNESEA